MASKKQIDKKTNRNTYSDIENKLMVTRVGRRAWDTGKYVKETKRYKLTIINYISHGDVIYSKWNIFNHIVITLHSN